MSPGLFPGVDSDHSQATGAQRVPVEFSQAPGSPVEVTLPWFLGWRPPWLMLAVGWSFARSRAGSSPPPLHRQDLHYRPLS